MGAAPSPPHKGEGVCRCVAPAASLAYDAIVSATRTPLFPRPLRLGAVALTSALLSGCVAAAIPPIIAGAVVGRRAIEGSGGGEASAAPVSPGEVSTAPVRTEGAPARSGEVANDIPPISAAPAAEAPNIAVSGSNATLDAADFAGRIALRLAGRGVRTAATATPLPTDRATGPGQASAILKPGAGLGWTDCADKPAAVIFDLDDASGRARVPSTQAFAQMIEALRALEATPLFFTRTQDAARIDALLTDLQVSGVGSGTRWAELWSPGGYAGRTRADLFATASRFHCVVAIAGDRLDDFAPSGRASALPAGAEAALGQRWFLMRELGAS